MKRQHVLAEAEAAVTGPREDSYGTPHENLARVAALWNAYMFHNKHDIREHGLRRADVACMMALLKIARLGNNINDSDGWIDLAGYAAIGAEVAGVHWPENEK